MTADLILTIGVLGTVAMFAVVGFVRTVQREIFVTAAILGAAAILDARAAAWGRTVAETIGIAEDTARFVVIQTAVVGSALLLGFLGGSLAGPVTASRGRRVAGAALAIFDAALLLSISLEAYSEFMAGATDQETIAASRAATVLRDNLGVLLVGGLLGTIGLIVMALALATRRPARLPAGRTYPGPARNLDDPEATLKVEPVTRPGLRAAALDQTMPLPPVDPVRTGDAGGRRDTARFRGGASGEWARVAPAPVDDRATATSCRSCGAVVSASDVYCLACGNLTR